LDYCSAGKFVGVEVMNIFLFWQWELVLLVARHASAFLDAYIGIQVTAHKEALRYFVIADRDSLDKRG